jgi:hypothetical protein
VYEYVRLTRGGLCPRIAEGSDPCGLFHGHNGPCVTFVPGDYLPPPLLHPLDWWAAFRTWPWTWWCPLCWHRADGFSDADFVTAFRGEQVNWGRPSHEWQITFEPCGCVGRTVDDDIG